MSPTLFKFVAKLYLSLFVVALLGVVLVFLVADFGDRLSVFLNHRVIDVAELYWHKSLMTLHQLSPAAPRHLATGCGHPGTLTLRCCASKTGLAVSPGVRFCRPSTFARTKVELLLSPPSCQDCQPQRNCLWPLANRGQARRMVPRAVP